MKTCKLLLMLLILFPICSEASILNAYNSTCQIIRKYDNSEYQNSGTGITISHSTHSIGILTAGHVAYPQEDIKYFVRFHTKGKTSHLIPAKITKRLYHQNTYKDLGLLTIKKKDFGKYPLPKPIPLANKNFKPSKNNLYMTVGCPDGSLPTLTLVRFQCHLEKKNINVFSPNLIIGRSGSAILDKDGTKIIGIVIWGKVLEKWTGSVTSKTIHNFLTSTKQFDVHEISKKNYHNPFVVTITFFFGLYVWIIMKLYDLL